MEFRVTVPGVPQPKGSGSKTKHGIYIEDGSKKSVNKKTGVVNIGSRERKKRWRIRQENVMIAAKSLALKEIAAALPLACPVRVDAIYYFPIPKSRTKGKKRLIPGQAHTQVPDADKLLRGTLDPLTKSKLIVDDRLVYEAHISKRWCATGDERAEIVITW